MKKLNYFKILRKFLAKTRYQKEFYYFLWWNNKINDDIISFHSIKTIYFIEIDMFDINEDILRYVLEYIWV
jgi:hypothetical protein